MTYSITRAGHIEFCVTDLDRAREFYVDLLGFVETGRDKGRLYLGGYEERDLYSIVLRQAPEPGVGHLAFRVSDEADLERLAALYQAHDLPVRRLAAGEEAGQGPAVRVQDPNGLPVEFFHQMEQRPRLLQQYDRYRGARVLRIDHFNCQVRDVQQAYDWWHDSMGFRCSEYTVSDDDPPRLWAAWLHRKQNVHDLALMNGIGPRLHHVGFWMEDRVSILNACDLLASAGYAGAMERGPGRHGLSNAFFLYLRDPDLNRIELYTSDYLIPDPDWEPVRWRLSDPRRATFWGHLPPRSWFDEASRVEDILTGDWMPVGDPPLAGRPEFIT